MVEADLHELARALRGHLQCLDLRDRHARGLFHQHVRARLQRLHTERGELIVRRGDDDHVGVEREQLRVGVDRRAEPLRGLAHDIVGPDDLVLRTQGLGALAADQPAARNGDAHRPAHA
jgi:hypothetical protein